MESVRLTIPIMDQWSDCIWSNCIYMGKHAIQFACDARIYTDGLEWGEKKNPIELLSTVNCTKYSMCVLFSPFERKEKNTIFFCVLKVAAHGMAINVNTMQIFMCEHYWSLGTDHFINVIQMYFDVKRPKHHTFERKSHFCTELICELHRLSQINVKIQSEIMFRLYSSLFILLWVFESKCRVVVGLLYNSQLFFHFHTHRERQKEDGEKKNSNNNNNSEIVNWIRKQKKEAKKVPALIIIMA